jgi:hypothetical protein
MRQWRKNRVVGVVYDNLNGGLTSGSKRRWGTKAGLMGKVS